MVIAQEIVHEISLNHYEVGTRLQTEKEMLEKYGVSRGTLRESLRYLEMNGVIVMKPGPGGGPFTDHPDSRDLAGTLALFLQINHTSFRSIIEARLLIEPIIAGLAAKNATSDLLTEIKESIDKMQENIDDLKIFLQTNEEFHTLVSIAANNSVFSLIMGSLHWITDGSPLGVDYPVERRVAVLEAHKKVYEAISSRSSENAENAMAHHVREFSLYLTRFYPNVYDSELTWGEFTR